MDGNREYRVSMELREIERQVDSHYKTNPLMQLSFGAAAWYYMSFSEYVAAKPFLVGEQQSVQEAAAFVDRFIFLLKNPFCWLLSSCESGGKPRHVYNGYYYRASIDLRNLAESYDSFEVAFTYASREIVELSLEGSTIVSNHATQGDTRYEAYSRIAKVETVPLQPSAGSVFDLVAESVIVSGEKFTFDLNPRVVSQAINMLSPVLDMKYSLPGEWDFGDFSLKEFRRVVDSLFAIACLHYCARLVAVKKGCNYLGYSSSIFLTGKGDLENRLVRYSGCDSSIVSRIIELMTYGRMGIEKPDPAIQPIIKINENTLALMPSLLIGNAVERNFTVLINKLPKMKVLYSKLVSEKEKVMREATKRDLTVPGVRYFNGQLSPELPDLDLTIISDVEKVCIILELKWFIEPAEVREVIEKSEEVAKGISQMLKLSDVLKTNPCLFFERLRVDAEYDFVFSVVSDNFIGMGNVQHPKIPVVRWKHFLNKANSLHSLRGTMEWLSDRRYLPIEGKHYEVIEETRSIGEWSNKWYGLNPLLTEEFL
jgi:hypothetical protein